MCVYTHLCADSLCEGGALQLCVLRGAGPRLHGDELDLVGLALVAVGRTARQTVHVVKDGGGGEQLIWPAARGGDWGREEVEAGVEGKSQ